VAHQIFITCRGKSASYLNGGNCFSWKIPGIYFAYILNMQKGVTRKLLVLEDCRSMVPECGIVVLLFNTHPNSKAIAMKVG
jgi:hypothetical protein